MEEIKYNGSLDLAYNSPPSLCESDKEIDKLNGIEEARDQWSVYTYNGVSVPRMTEILKECIGKEYLISYALRCKNYYEESNKTLYIGTVVHEMIDEFLLHGTAEFDNNIYTNEDVFKKIYKAYNNFVRWYNDRIAEGYKIEVLEIEKSIVTPWFGGTIDCIMKITDQQGISKTYIIDFKTSSKIAIDYLVQTYGYMWGVNWYVRNIDPSAYPQIDGIGIIRVDKKYKSYNDIFLSLNGDINNFMNMANINDAFVHCLNWFYYQKNLEWILKNNK